MDVTFEKKNNKTTIKTVAAHPTMVWVWSKGVTGSEGFLYFPIIERLFWKILLKVESIVIFLIQLCKKKWILPTKK